MSDFDPASNLVAGVMVDQNDSIDQQGSIITAAFLNGLELEQKNLITLGGLVPAFGTNNQVAAAVTAYVAAQIAAQSRVPNHLPDPCCRVANGPAALALSTSRQYGQVQLVQAWASVGAVTAGTIVQDAAGNGGGKTPYSVKLAGVTLTGAGAALSWRRFMESVDAQDYIGGPALFACTIKQTTGGALNMSFAVNKANAVNNFGAVTNIGNSGLINVPSGVPTPVSFVINNMGACGNGIELIPTLVTGPIVAQDIYITDFQISPSTVVAPFEIPKLAMDRQAVLRFDEYSYDDGVAAGTATPVGMYAVVLSTTMPNANTSGSDTNRYMVPKCVTPVITLYSSNSGASGKVYDASALADKTFAGGNIGKNSYHITNNSGGTLAANDALQWQSHADARL